MLQNVTSHAVITGSSDCGGLVGSAKSLAIEDCVSDVNITGICYSAGGFVGNIKNGDDVNVTFHESTSTASVSSGYHFARIGGFVGDTMMTSNELLSIIQSTSHCFLFDSDNSPHAGGFIGQASCSGSSRFVIENSTNNGDITSLSSSSYIGGFIGGASASDRAVVSIRNSLNTGSMKAMGNSIELGGFVGFFLIPGNSGTVTLENNTNHGEVNGNSSSCDVGGFVGCLAASSGGSFIASNNTNYGSVWGNSFNKVGGIVGYLTDIVKVVFLNNTNHGSVACFETVCDAGGFVGQAYVSDGSITVSIKTCTNNGNVNASSHASGFVGVLYSSGTTSVLNASFESNTNNGNISAPLESSVASGFFNTEFNSDTNVSSAVLNSVNNGFVNGKSAFGITKSLSHAHNVVNTRFVVGSTFAKLLWDNVDDASSFYSLNDMNRNENGIFFTSDDMRVDDMLNKEATTNGYEMAWTSTLSLAESVVQVSAYGVIEERWTVGVGTVLGDIEILSLAFESGEHTIVDADNQNALDHNTVVTRNMTIFISGSSSSSSPLQSSSSSSSSWW